MKLTDIKDDLKIEMIETGQGCPEACMHCGAYERFDQTSLRLVDATPEQLRHNLQQVSA